MNKSTPPSWLVWTSVLLCILLLEYYRTTDTRTDYVTSYYPGQSDLLKALSEDHAIVPVVVFGTFEVLKRLDR